MKPVRAIREVPHLMIPLPDGTRLAARLWLPEGAEADPVPAILEYLPYRKRDGTAERDALTHPWLARHGYACLRVDIRGSGESDGLLDDEYSRQELADAVPLIAWLASQTWCNGAVGMMGISWGGFNGLQVAALRPPALKAIVTLCSTDDRYRDDVHYMGGAKLTAGFGWAGFFFADICRPPDPALVGERWREMWLERLNHLPVLLKRWLSHPHRDAYWKHGSVCEDFSAIACPVFAVGGWTDGYTNAIPRLLERLSVPRQGLIGPWAHAYPHFARPGPQIGFLQEMLAWWDRWLKGEQNGVMDKPMVRAWITDSHAPVYPKTLPGRWVAEPSWPPPSRRTLRLALTDNGLAASGSLAPREINSPLDLGKCAGEWCPFGPDDQAGDQRDDDTLSLCFDTPPLEGPAELLGAPVVELDLTCDKPVAYLIARLCDLRPDGSSLLVSFGVLNLTHRDSDETPTALVPGQRYRIRLQLNDCGARLPAGHRFRLALSTSYWPMVWPVPERATVTVLGGSLNLPARDSGRELAVPPFAPPESAPPAAVTRLGPGHVRFEDFGLDVRTTRKFDSHIDPADPASAAIGMECSETVSRGDWQVRIETSLKLTASRDAWRVVASLAAYEGEREVCRRDWDSAVPRNLI